jgi:methionyl-tRNA formyltransferase
MVDHLMKDVGLILANTSRSRAYLAALVRHNLHPSWVLLLDDDSKEIKLGQSSGRKGLQVVNSITDDCWSESYFNPEEPLEPWLRKLGLNFVISNTQDIHSTHVIELIARAKPSVMIYSGYGGVLLRDCLIDCGKRFLHIHGGYLPEFKGSTTNYYSLISDKHIGASAIFLSNDIDSGPLLYRKKFSIPKSCLEIDHIYDSAARARVLVDVLKDYKNNQKWSYLTNVEEKSKLFYIIHPVLKHLAILKNDSEY